MGSEVCFFFLMIRLPSRSTQSRSSAASDVYKRQAAHASKSSGTITLAADKNWLRITADNFETVFNTDEARMILLRYHNSDIIHGHEGLTYNGYRYISNNKRDWKPTAFEVKDFSYQLAEDHSLSLIHI